MLLPSLSWPRWVLPLLCGLVFGAGAAAQAKTRIEKAADLPRFFDYMTKVALRYRPLQPLLPLIEPLSGRVVRSGYTF